MLKYKYNDNLTFKTDFFGPETAIRARVIDYNYGDGTYRVSFERPDTKTAPGGIGYVNGGLHNMWITQDIILEEVGVLRELGRDGYEL